MPSADGDRLEFVALAPPSQEDVETLTLAIARRITKLVRKEVAEEFWRDVLLGVLATCILAGAALAEATAIPTKVYLSKFCRQPDKEWIQVRNAEPFEVNISVWTQEDVVILRRA